MTFVSFSGFANAIQLGFIALNPKYTMRNPQIRKINQIFLFMKQAPKIILNVPPHLKAKTEFIIYLFAELGIRNKLINIVIVKA